MNIPTNMTRGLFAALILMPALALAQDAEVTMRMQYADEIMAKLNTAGKTVKLRTSKAFMTKDKRAKVRELNFEVDGVPGALTIRRVDWQAEIRPEFGNRASRLRNPQLAIQKAIRELANANRKGQLLFLESRDSTLVMAKGKSLADGAFLARVQGALFVPPFGNAYAKGSEGIKTRSMALAALWTDEHGYGTQQTQEKPKAKSGLAHGLDTSVVSDKKPPFARKYRNLQARERLTRKMLRTAAGIEDEPYHDEKARIRPLDRSRK